MLKGKTAIVTGASDGLGELISYGLASKGVHVIGIARREERLKYIKDEIEKRNGKFSYVSADVSDMDRIASIVKEIYASFGGAEILVNNAGIFHMDYFPRIEFEKYNKMIDLNLKGPIKLYYDWLNEYTRAEKKSDLKKPEVVLWMSSVSGIRAYGGNSVYAATKYGMRGFVHDQRTEYVNKDLDDKILKAVGPFLDLNLRHILLYPDSADTGIIFKTEGNLYANPKDYEYMKKDTVSDFAVDILEKPMISDDVEIGIREKDGKKGVYAIFYQPDFQISNQVSMKKLSDV